MNGVKADLAEHFLAAVTLFLAWLVTTFHTEDDVTMGGRVGVGGEGICVRRGRGELHGGLELIAVAVENALELLPTVSHFD